MNHVLRHARLQLLLVAVVSSVRAAEDFGPLAGTGSISDGLKINDVEMAIITAGGAPTEAERSRSTPTSTSCYSCEQSGWRSTLTLISTTKEVGIIPPTPAIPTNPG